MTKENMKYWVSRLRVEDRIISLIIGIFLLFVGFITVYPFLHTLAISLNDSIDTVRGGITLFPRDFTTAAYERLLRNNVRLGNAAVMSVLRTVVGVSMATLSTILIAYALSRKEFILRRIISFMVILTMYVSGGLIPNYFLFRSLGLLNNFWVYILPHLAAAFNIIIVRTFIKQQPDSFIESARIDGANEFRIIFQIVMPIILPAIAVTILFIAVFHWNSWVDTYIYASRNVNLSTLQFELQKRLQSAMSIAAQDAQSAQEALSDAEAKSEIVTPEAVRAAMTMVTFLPIVMIYPFLQRYFVSGLMVGGLKE
jgi:putative aldouronate transport system permease protein